MADSICKTPKTTTFHDSIFKTPNTNSRLAQVTFGNFSDLENLVSFLEQTVVQTLTRYLKIISNKPNRLC
jgi:hypothetical protein